MTPGIPGHSHYRPVSAVALAAVGALLLTACGSDDPDVVDDGTRGGPDTGEPVRGEAAPLYEQLPEEIRDAGVITVGSDIDYEPLEFVDEDDQVAGIDPDIAEALADVLGVDFEFHDIVFDDLIPDMNDGRVDIIMSGMTDTAERQEGVGGDAEGGADFVNYFRSGSALLVAGGNPESIEELADLCGRTVALQLGTANEDLATAQSGECDTPLEIVSGDQDSESLEELAEGRADAVITDYPVALHQASTAGGGDTFDLVGDQIEAAPYGIAVPKADTELRDVLREALQMIIDDGTYLDILTTWEAENAAVDEVTINAGE